jgi:hypothetical protein
MLESNQTKPARMQTLSTMALSLSVVFNLSLCPCPSFSPPFPSPSLFHSLTLTLCLSLSLSLSHPLATATTSRHVCSAITQSFSHLQKQSKDSHRPCMNQVAWEQTAWPCSKWCQWWRSSPPWRCQINNGSCSPAIKMYGYASCL